MKYLIIMAGIIGLVVYIFIGGPRAAGKDAPPVDRREQVWDRIAMLEHQRRDMLIRAQGRLGAYTPVAAMTRRGAYAVGYREGFSQGYFEGSFLAEGRKPNPLFFGVPNP